MKSNYYNKIIKQLELKLNTLNEDLVNFPIANVKRKNGAIGTQGVTAYQIFEILTNVAKMNLHDKMSMEEMINALKADAQAQQRLRSFTQKNPVKIKKLPDDTFHIQDGHHRTFLLNQIGDEAVPAILI